LRPCRRRKTEITNWSFEFRSIYAFALTPSSSLFLAVKTPFAAGAVTGRRRVAPPAETAFPVPGFAPIPASLAPCTLATRPRRPSARHAVDAVAVLDVSATRVAAPFNHRRRSSRPHPFTMPNSSSPLPLLALEPELELPAPEAPPAIAMAAELGSSWHRPLRFLFPQIKPPAAFLASPRASQGRPPLLIAAGELPPRHPMAAVALLPWSSPVRPSYTTTEPPDRFNSPPGSSPTPPPPPQATGTPPPLHRPAAAPCFTPASPVRPSPRAPRPPTGAPRRPLPFPPHLPRRRRASTPETRPFCPPLFLVRPGTPG
jgi:hypothetical protein